MFLSTHNQIIYFVLFAFIFFRIFDELVESASLGLL